MSKRRVRLSNAATMGEKKIKGRKRHIVTDTNGHLLHVQVHAANIHDTTVGGHILQGAVDKYPSLQGVSLDAGYRKTTANFVTNVLKKKVNISSRVKSEWTILAKRWVVERTFAWFIPFRRLAKDFEISLTSAEAFIMIAHAAMLIIRLK